MDIRSRDDDYDDRDAARGEPLAPAGGEGADRPDTGGGQTAPGDGQSEQPGEAARIRLLAGQVSGLRFSPTPRGDLIVVSQGLVE